MTNYIDFKNYMLNTYKKLSKKAIKNIFLNDKINIEELKSFCDKYKIKFTIYSNNQEIFCNINKHSKSYKNLYCNYDGINYIVCNKLYIKCNSNILEQSIMKRILSHKKRDIDKNNKTILLSELFYNKKKYIDYYIVYKSFPMTDRFSKVLEIVNEKKIIKLNNNDYKILEYLIINYGLVFNLVHNNIKIEKKNINDNFLNKYKNYAITLKKKYYEYNVNYTYGSDKIDNMIIYCKNDPNIITEEEIHIKLINEISVSSDSNDREVKKINKYTLNTKEQVERNCYYQVQCIESMAHLYNIIEENNSFILSKIKEYNEYIININYIDTNNVISINDVHTLLENNICNLCNIDLSLKCGDKNIFTIDAINPLLGHTKNNICLLCRSCNAKKNNRYINSECFSTYRNI